MCRRRTRRKVEATHRWQKGRGLGTALGPRRRIRRLQNEEKCHSGPQKEASKLLPERREEVLRCPTAEEDIEIGVKNGLTGTARVGAAGVGDVEPVEKLTAVLACHLVPLDHAVDSQHRGAHADPLGASAR